MTETTIAQAFVAWQAARAASRAALQADDEATAEAELERAADLERLALNLPANSARDVLALVAMMFDPGEGNSHEANTLIARAHAVAA